jgi:hypothetical protein
MRVAKLAIAIAAIALTPYNFAHAEEQLTTTQQAYSQTESMIAQTNTVLQGVIAGLRNYYVANLGWPTSLASISNYYTGTYTTPIGTVTGAITASSYKLSITLSVTDAQIVAQAKTLASKLNGSYNTGSKTLTIAVDPPQNAAIVSSMLSRFPDTTGSGLNTMMADLSMDNNDVNDIGTANASIVNATTVNATDVNTDNVTAATLISAPTANITALNATTIAANVVTTPQIKSNSGLIKLVNNTQIDGDTTFSKNITQAAGKVMTAGILNVQNAASFSANITQTAGSASFQNLVASSLVSASDVTAQGAMVFTTGLYNGGGTPIADASGKLFYQGQDLDSRSKCIAVRRCRCSKLCSTRHS